MLLLFCQCSELHFIALRLITAQKMELYTYEHMMLMLMICVRQIVRTLTRESISYMLLSANDKIILLLCSVVYTRIYVYMYTTYIYVGLILESIISICIARLSLVCWLCAISLQFYAFGCVYVLCVCLTLLASGANVYNSVSKINFHFVYFIISSISSIRYIEFINVFCFSFSLSKQIK